MNHTPSTQTEQAKNMFLGFNESLANDPEFVNEFLEGEGYDLGALDAKGDELFRKIELSNRMNPVSVEKQKALEEAKRQVFEQRSDNEQETAQNQALEVALYRDFKESSSSEDVSAIRHDQNVLARLSKKDEDTKKSN